MFDPATSSLPWNWISLTPLIFCFFLKFFKKKSRVLVLHESVIRPIVEQTSLSSPGAKWIVGISSLMYFILSLNLSGLLPWVFTPTGYPSVTLSWGLTLWSGWLILMFSKHLSELLASLSPKDISLGLALFLALVETVSLAIRPLTLAIRLAANMIAGHLILSLVSSFIASMSILLCVPLSVLTLLIFILEVAVAMIQSYVFITLLTLYIS